MAEAVRGLRDYLAQLGSETAELLTQLASRKEDRDREMAAAAALLAGHGGRSDVGF